MTIYETMYIIHPDVTDENIEAINEKMKKVLTENDAKIINFEDLGVKKLAYKVKKQLKGHFVLVNYEGPAQAISELERRMKVSDEVIKFFSIKLEKDEVVRLEKMIAARNKAASEPKPAEKVADVAEVAEVAEAAPETKPAEVAEAAPETAPAEAVAETAPAEDAAKAE